jgi:4-diphosphocytidyl-2-C-methyl-D-erythritol kinase
MTATPAYAKLNLSLVVGPVREDGMHEVATVMQAIDLHDDLQLEPADGMRVDGFDDDTLVRDALEALSARAGSSASWQVRIEKRIPVAAGLGGGSSDAAAALQLANESLPEPLLPDALRDTAAALGADVAFFLEGGSQLATNVGSRLLPLELPTEYVAVVVLPSGERKASTRAVYQAFDERDGAVDFDDRRAELLRTLALVRRPCDLSLLPSNDLASSPLAAELLALGAFRADVTGAGPAVYGLFEQEPKARKAASSLVGVGQTWLARPVPSSRSGGAKVV